MYRAATSGQDYHLENVNLASLAGVLAYLHHEVICNGGCPDRKFNINHIQRYKVTFRSTREAYDSCNGHQGQCEYSPEPWGKRTVVEGSPGHQFMRFAGFDAGKIAWEPVGLPSVGCSTHEIKRTFYNHSYEDATYYSLPGRCYSRRWDEANKTCIAKEPGGECASPSDLDAEDTVCTWHAERQGEVWLDELTGISDRALFCSQGGREWWSDDEIDICALNTDVCTDCSLCPPASRCLVSIEAPGKGSGRDPAPRKCWQEEGCQWEGDSDATWAGSAEGIEHNFVQGGRQCFWDGRNDPQRNAERVARLEAVFAAKYPHVRPANIVGPACGW